MLPTTEEWEISPARLKALERGEIRLIDCREEDEFALCKLEGAELIPLSRFAEMTTQKLLPRPEAKMVVYCHHGMRSLQATQYLRQKGIAHVWSLAGGIDRWSLEIDSDVPRY